jgi:competence protein ComEA
VPELPISRRRALLAGAALLAALLFGSRLLSHGGSAAPPLPTLPPPTFATTTAPPTRVVVDVVGAVRRPGLYRLAQGARVADAVARAGGSTRKADLALVNLAALVSDGEQVVVPRRGVAVGAAGAAAGGAAGGGASGASGIPTGPVHLNGATVEQLDALPGVGPVTAQKIIDYRQKHGAFTSVDELDAVSGIGPARLDQLRDLVAP